MKILSKKYRVVYSSENEIIMNPFEEYAEHSRTAVGEGRLSAEFDTLEEVQNFINENNLVYDPATW